MARSKPPNRRPRRALVSISLTAWPRLQWQSVSVRVKPTQDGCSAPHEPTWRPSAERNSSMRQHQHQREPVRETELRQLSDLLPSPHLSCTTCVTTPTRFSSFLYQRLALARVNPAGMRRGVSVQFLRGM